MAQDHSLLFTLKLALERGMRPIVIRAFEGPWQHPNHTRIDVEVRHEGRTVFERGELWCGVPSHHSIDGINAKECVLSLVAMKPGDTDSDYFANYSPAQLEWVERWGERLSFEAHARYCDEDGNVKEAV